MAKVVYYWEWTPFAPKGKFIIGRYCLSSSRPSCDCEHFTLYRGEDINDIKAFLKDKYERNHTTSRPRASSKITGSLRTFYQEQSKLSLGKTSTRKEHQVDQTIYNLDLL